MDLFWEPESGISKIATDGNGLYEAGSYEVMLYMKQILKPKSLSHRPNVKKESLIWTLMLWSNQWYELIIGTKHIEIHVK